MTNRNGGSELDGATLKAAGCGRHPRVPAPFLWTLKGIPWAGTFTGDIAGTVATMTEGERVPRVKEPPTAPWVNQDSATRRVRRLVVQSDVGELGFALRSVRNREAVPAPHHFTWHYGCFGWRVQVQNDIRNRHQVLIGKNPSLLQVFERYPP